MRGRRRLGGLYRDTLFIVAGLVLLWTAAPSASAQSPRRHPDVLKVSVRRGGANVYSFDVTISSPDTGWKKYANAFRVRTLDGKVLGTRILYHPHVDEQPFTRSLTGVRIPADVEEVLVEARDSVAGWGGKSLRVKIRR